MPRNSFLFCAALIASGLGALEGYDKAMTALINQYIANNPESSCTAPAPAANMLLDFTGECFTGNEDVQVQFDSDANPVLMFARAAPELS